MQDQFSNEANEMCDRPEQLENDGKEISVPQHDTATLMKHADDVPAANDKAGINWLERDKS